MKLFLLATYLATWAFIPHLLFLKKRPAATLAWLWAILFIPWLGACAYFAIGTDRLKRHRLRRRRLFSARTLHRREESPATDEASATLLRGLNRRDRQFLQLVSRINQLPASSAGDLRLLSNAAEFFPALEAAILAARHHVHLEFYIWQADDTGRHFLRLLTDAARRGVKVRLLLDGVGSRKFGPDLLVDFVAAGGRFSWFQSLDPRRGRFFMNLRNHRKLQIIDGHTAFVGGMNIGREYEGRDELLGDWRDAQVEVHGAIAAELQEVFADDWFFATDEKISDPAFYPDAAGRAEIPVHIVLGGPDRRNEPVTKTIVSLLNHADDRVWIGTGYFVPDDTVLNALELSASRGVDVRLLVSEKNDHPWLVTVGRSYYTQLLAAGVRIFEYSAGVHHAKMVLADDRWVMIGSANLDYRSLRLNFELNLLFHSPARNRDVTATLEHDFALCREITLPAFSRRSFGQRFAEAALRPLSPLL